VRADVLICGRGYEGGMLLSFELYYVALGDHTFSNYWVIGLSRRVLGLHAQRNEGGTSSFTFRNVGPE
jgi:hypothetical protein